jgi:biopolymer transport protein TolR
VLVLLVVFMVITPMLQSGKPVDLPEATQSTTVNDVGQFIVVSITKDKVWWVEQEEVDDDTLLEAIYREYERGSTGDDVKTRTILLKGDRSLEYRDVRALLDVLTERGISSVKIATKKEG